MQQLPINNRRADPEFDDHPHTEGRLVKIGRGLRNVDSPWAWLTCQSSHLAIELISYFELATKTFVSFHHNLFGNMNSVHFCSLGL